MCELTGESMRAATKAAEPLPPETLAMKRIAEGIDAFFAPHLARAQAQADKIAAAAKACREADDETPECAA